MKSNQKLALKISSVFKKDLKLLSKRGFNLEELSVVVDYLQNGKLLPSKYKDHALQGDYYPERECHIRPDWLLIYYIDKKNGILELDRTGTHSDLF